MKEVIKKQLDNAPKGKDDEKSQMTQIKGLIQPILTCSNNFATSVNTTSMESCFGVPTFYVDSAIINCMNMAATSHVGLGFLKSKVNFC